MKEVKLNEINVGDRFRKKFEDIDKLAESISKNGLIEPIIIDEHFNLIAGERRFKAHQLLAKETILARTIADLSELEKKEIEIEENVQRKAFTWQEECFAKKHLHELKQELHGSAVKGHDSSGWSMRDTAQALDESVGTVSMDIQLAKGIKAFPELMKEKSKTAAFKKLKTKQEQLLQAEMAKRIKSSGLIDRPEVMHGDCIDVMKRMDSDSIDLIVTDPPYGVDIGDAKVFKRDKALDVGFEDSDFATFDMLDRAVAEMSRILKEGSHMYIFCGIDKAGQLGRLLLKHGLTVHKFPLIWDKGSGGYPSQMTTYVHSYEVMLHCWKGKGRKLNGTPRDVFTIKRCPSGRKIHPTEKPTELLRDLINLSSNPGERVFDPFCGSGSTVVAAKETSRIGSGVELNEVYYTNICNRLGGLDGQEDTVV